MFINVSTENEIKHIIFFLLNGAQPVTLISEKYHLKF
jgi:hypothetical protein